MIDDFRRATKSNTKMYMVETPCNPNMHIVDLEELGKLGQEMDVITAVDSTFASPINLVIAASLTEASSQQRNPRPELYSPPSAPPPSVPPLLSTSLLIQAVSAYENVIGS